MTVESLDDSGSGSSSSISGCVVRSITPSGAIGKDGRIEVGDVIVSVNHESLRRITTSQARAILRRTSLIGIDIKWEDEMLLLNEV